MSATKVGDLSGAPYNPRKIEPEAYRILGKTLDFYGDLSGIVFNIRTGRLVGGHQRLKHLDPSWPIISESVKDSRGTVALGHIVTPWGALAFRSVDWDEKTEKAANIAANRPAGEFDVPLLKDLLVDIDDGSFDMELTGFEAEDLKELLTTVPEVEDPEEKGGTKSATCPSCGKVFVPGKGDA